MPKTSETFLGAIASTAGDNFHERWVAREALRLLDPHSDVVSIDAERAPEDEVHAELGHEAQAIDVAFSLDTDGRRHYRYLQLKYSPSPP